MAKVSNKMQRAAARRFESLFGRRIAHRICLRVFQGESLAAICRDPDMPCHKTVYNWIAREPEFAAMMRTVQAKARLKARAALIARREARRTRPKKRNCPGSQSTYHPDMAALICEQLQDGASLQEICRQPGLPSIGTVYNWLQAYPEFAVSYGAARWIQAELIAARATDMVLALTPADDAGRMDAMLSGVRRLMIRASHLQPRVWGEEDGWGEVTVVEAT